MLRGEKRRNKSEPAPSPPTHEGGAGTRCACACVARAPAVVVGDGGQLHVLRLSPKHAAHATQGECAMPQTMSGAHQARGIEMDLCRSPNKRNRRASWRWARARRASQRWARGQTCHCSVCDGRRQVQSAFSVCIELGWTVGGARFCGWPPRGRSTHVYI